MQEQAVARAADALFQARTEGIFLPQLPEGAEPESAADGYAIQDVLHDRLRAAGWGAIVGHKIGCTSRVMQEYLNIHEPCAGKIFDTTVQVGTGVYQRDTFNKPGVECEIAVRLGAGLDAREDGHTPESVADAVAAAMASIELVDWRYADFGEQSVGALIADDFFNAGCVLGAEVSDIDPARLKRFPGRMRVNGEIVGEGVGSDILDDPMAALAWLANLRAGQGQPLKAGEFVTLGSIVKTVYLDAGDLVEMEIDGLGPAALRML